MFNLLVSDLQELGQAINKLQQTAQNDVAKKTQEVYEPIIEKAKKAIAEVAKDKGYTYGAYSFFQGAKNTGLFCIQTSVKTEVTDSALADGVSSINTNVCCKSAYFVNGNPLLANTFKSGKAI